MLCAFLLDYNNQKLPSNLQQRVQWGEWSLSSGAQLWGRLYSFFARLADGIPVEKKEDARPMQFSTNCITFEKLNDIEAYINGFNAACGQFEENGGVVWTKADELYHYARGVEAFFTGRITVWDEEAFNPTQEIVSLNLVDVHCLDQLCEGENKFRKLTGEVRNGGLRITRCKHSAKERDEVIRRYVAHHIFKLNPTSVPTPLDSSRKRQKKEADPVSEGMQSTTTNQSVLDPFDTNAPRTSAEQNGYKYSMSPNSERRDEIALQNLFKNKDDFVASMLISPQTEETEEEANETTEERNTRVGKRGDGVYIVVDTRSTKDMSSPDAKAKVNQALEAMDMPFKDDEGMKYAFGNRANPSSLWNACQTVISQTATSITAAALDDALTKETSSFTRWTERNNRALVPVSEGGRSNVAYKWNETIDNKTVRDINLFIETHVPPVKYVTAIQTSRPSRKRQGGPNTVLHVRQPMVIRAPKLNNGSTLKNAIETINQYLVASKHDVGVRVSTAILFSMDRLFDKDAWNELGERGQVSAFRNMHDESHKYGVIMIVEQMKLETNSFLDTPDMHTSMQPNISVDGITRNPSRSDDGFDAKHHAMRALWTLLARMSSIGMVFLDFHLGNVMFNIENGKYIAKVVDIDPNLGGLLSHDDLGTKEGTSVLQGWKPLFVLNALTVAFALAGDDGRIRLFTKWASADKAGEINIGHFNHFKRICKEVYDVLDPKLYARMSIPEKLLCTQWNGGYKGTGLGNASRGALDAEIYDYVDEGEKNTIDRLHARSVSFYSASDNTLERLTAAIRETLHQRAVKEPRVFFKNAWEVRQTCIHKLADGSEWAGKEGQSFSARDIEKLISQNTHSHVGQQLAIYDNYIRNKLENVLGPMMRYSGAIHKEGQQLISFLGDYVFKPRCKHDRAFADSSITAPIVNFMADKTTSNLKILDLVEFYDASIAMED